MQAFEQFTDIHISFFCRTTYENEKCQNPIVLRVAYRGERRDIFTGLYCYKSDWTPKMGKVSRTEPLAVTINRNLDAIHHKAKQRFDELRFSGDEFSIDDLVDRIKGKEPPPQTLVEYMDLKIKELEDRVNVDLSRPTFYKYNRTKKYMEEFLLSKKRIRNIPVSRIDGNFLTQFFQFLRRDKNNSHNSALALLFCLKTILQAPLRNGTLKSNPFLELKISAKTVYRDFLTIEEIETLEKMNIESEFIDRTRNIFLFACYTGLSYSDIQQLKKEHFIPENDGTFHISKPRQKTGVISIIPLLPPAQRILAKYSLSDDIRDFSWYVPSNQKLNKNLKSIGESAGFTKKLFMHLARHTFATTITLSNGVPLETVSKMLGHSETKTTQIYAKVVAGKIKMDMDRIRSIFK